MAETLGSQEQLPVIKVIMFPVNPDDLLRVSANPYQEAVEVKVLKIEGSKRGERTFTLNNNPSANPDATNTLVLTEKELYDWLVNAGDERVDKIQVQGAAASAPTLVEPPPPPAAPPVPAAPPPVATPTAAPLPPSTPPLPSRSSAGRNLFQTAANTALSYLSTFNNTINQVSKINQLPIVSSPTREQQKLADQYKVDLDTALPEYFKNDAWVNALKKSIASYLKNNARDFLPDTLRSMGAIPVPTNPLLADYVRNYILDYVQNKRPDILPRPPKTPQTP